METFKIHLLIFGLITLNLSAFAQVWNGTSNPQWTNSNVGIGFASAPTLTDKLVVNGNISILNAGRLAFQSSSEGGSSFMITGESYNGNYSGEDAVQGTNIQILAGSSNGVTGTTGIGGSLILQGGYGNNLGKGGDVLINSFGGGCVAIGAQYPVTNAKLHVEGQSYFNGQVGIATTTIAPSIKLQVAGNTYIQGSIGIGAAPVSTKLHVQGKSYFSDGLVIGTANTTPKSMLEITRYNSFYIQDNSSTEASLSWNCFKDGTTWKSSANSLCGMSLAMVNSPAFPNNATLNLNMTKNNPSTGYLTSFRAISISTNFQSLTQAITFGAPSLTNSAIFPGTVRIGTNVTLPAGYGLAVAGGIITTKFKIARVESTDWKDNVFERGYPLLTIQEVDTFITKNGHLPEVPSACEVEKNGFELVKMNATLLQKIEELTLYIIQMEKRMKMLEDQKR